MTDDGQKSQFVKALVECALKLKQMYESSRSENAQLHSRVSSLEERLAKAATQEKQTSEANMKSIRILQEQVTRITAELAASTSLCEKLAELQPSDLKLALVEEKSRSFDLKKKLERATFLLAGKVEEAGANLRTAEEGYKVKLSVLLARIEAMEADAEVKETARQALVQSECRLERVSSELNVKTNLCVRLEAELAAVHTELHALQLETVQAGSEQLHKLTVLESEKLVLESENQILLRRLEIRETVEVKLRERMQLVDSEVAKLRPAVAQADTLSDHNRALHQQVTVLETELKECEQKVLELEKKLGGLEAARNRAEWKYVRLKEAILRQSREKTELSYE